MKISKGEKILDKAWETMEILTGMAMLSKIQTMALIADRHPGEDRNAVLKKAELLYDDAVRWAWASYQAKEVAPESLVGGCFLDDPIGTLRISARARNCLCLHSGVKTIRELVGLTHLDLIRIKGMGRATAREIAVELDRMGVKHQLHDPRTRTEGQLVNRV